MRLRLSPVILPVDLLPVSRRRNKSRVLARIPPTPPASDFHPKSHLDDGVVGNLEEVGCAAGDTIQKRENRKRDRLYCRSDGAANDGLVGDVIVLVVEI